MFLSEFICFASESFYRLSNPIVRALSRRLRVEVAQLLPHLPEQSVLERLQLAKAEHFGGILVFFISWSLDEVKDVSLFLLCNLTLGHIFEDPAQVVAHGVIVIVEAERLNGHLV